LVWIFSNSVTLRVKSSVVIILYFINGGSIFGAAVEFCWLLK